MHTDAASAPSTQRLIISGRVQGVGFRPYVYRQATRHRLKGWVRNISGRVEVCVQGDEQDVDAFITGLLEHAPPLSQAELERVEPVAALDCDGFSIVDSEADADVDIHVPADLYTCEHCLNELKDPADRRYRYPFINCTQCGPRYSIIRSLPYDRVNTSMATFQLCDACAAEYADVSDRRYHAEPVACDLCGPELCFVASDGRCHAGNESALDAALAALADGELVAIKGIGGYHLACDARRDSAVQRLRQLKPRPHKPLAVMFDDSMLPRYLNCSSTEQQMLASPQRPIVQVEMRAAQDAEHRLSRYISPGLNTIGAMLPYSPLHRLLLDGLEAPLVMTSANVSGEPVLTDNDEVERRLGHVAQAYLHHDREILRPVDDSVYREIAGVARPLRAGRGLAPIELRLPFELERAVLAVGCHMKNTVTLAWHDRAVVSPHIGEMHAPRSLDVFERTITELQRLYQVEAELIICDANPSYGSSTWARRQSLPAHPVYHHHAHASACWVEAGEMAAGDDMLVFTWDGVGLGPDNKLWGGEALLGAPGRWRKAACFRPFRLPGGERAGREPWRSAAALCWEDGLDCDIPAAQDPLLRSFWEQGRNAPVTTAVGRLFDAAAALTGVCERASFEGQAPMWLETVAMLDVAALELPLVQLGGVYTADWSPLLPMLMNRNVPVGRRAGCFHTSLANSLLQQALRLRLEHGVGIVGLSGGVFQNRKLSELAIALLQAHGFDVVLARQLPVNDASISFGQVIEYGSSQRRPGGD